MNILVIAPQPFFTIRGTPLAVRELVSTFIKLGHRVSLLTFHLGEDIELPGLCIYRNRLLKGVIKSIPPGFSWSKFMLDIVLLFKALFLILKNNYDVVHCIEEMAYFMVWFRWIKGFKFVYDMDSDIPEQMSDKIKSRFILGFLRWIEGYTIKNSNVVVTICPALSADVRDVDAEKPVFQIEDVSLVEEVEPMRRPSERKVILYTGNFEEYQGVRLLLEGFKKVEKDYPDVDLLLVGGEESEIVELKKRYGGNHIVFIGKKPFSEIPHFLKLANILVSPRLRGKNTPFKMYSYLASEKPILATNIISHNQILTNGQDALLVEPTREGIENGLTNLLSNPDLMARLGRNARVLFETKYTRRCYEEKVRSYINFLER